MNRRSSLSLEETRMGNPVSLTFSCRIWRRIAAAIALLALSSVAAYQFGSYPRRPSLGASPLNLAEQELDFGDVWETNAFNWKLHIENKTNAEITIKDIASSCTCVAIEPRSFVLPPRSLAQVTLTLDLTPRGPNSGGSVIPSVRAFETAIHPRVEGFFTLPWRLHGRVRSVMSISPEVLEFGQNLVRGHDHNPRTISVKPHIPLKELVASCEPPIGSVRVTRTGSQTDALRPFEIELKPAKEIALSTFQGQLILQPLSEDGDILPPRRYPSSEGRLASHGKLSWQRRNQPWHDPSTDTKNNTGVRCSPGGRRAV
jgi:hypothetical protein